jgi:serine/threonine protein kinase
MDICQSQSQSQENPLRELNSPPASFKSDGMASQLNATQTENAYTEECARWVPEPECYARLISLDPEISIKQFMLAHPNDQQRKREYTLGRSNTCDFHFPDPRISHIHCRIYSVCNHSMELECWIVDNSANGTYMRTNGSQSVVQKLVKGAARQLRTGDEVFLTNPVAQSIGSKLISKNGEQTKDESYKSSAFIVILSNASHARHFGHVGAMSMSQDTTCEAVDTYLENSQDYCLHYRSKGSKRSMDVDEGLSQSSVSSSTNSQSKVAIQSKLQKKRSFYDFYEVSNTVLGTGTYASVREARRKNDGTIWAVKIINTRTLQQANTDLILREAEMLCSLRHRCITRLTDIFQDQSNVFLVMEMCVGGDLFDRIMEMEHGRYPEEKARQCMRNILDGLCYLHSKGVAHRDIKPENILLCSKHDDVNIKISDFGLAKRVDATSRLRTIVGTPIYYAPEISRCLGAVAGLAEYSVEADMWSLGVLLYALLFGRLPWQLEDIHAYEARVKLGQPCSRVVTFPCDLVHTVSATALDLITKLLIEQPSMRLTAEQTLNHPWITGKPRAPGKDVNRECTADHYDSQVRSEANRMEISPTDSPKHVTLPTTTPMQLTELKQQSEIASGKVVNTLDTQSARQSLEQLPPEAIVRAPSRFALRAPAQKAASVRMSHKANRTRSSHAQVSNKNVTVAAPIASLRKRQRQYSENATSDWTSESAEGDGSSPKRALRRRISKQPIDQ